MGYVLKAVLSSAQHPEYGQITTSEASSSTNQCSRFSSHK